MLTGEQFRALALALPGAVEGAHMGHADFRANGRVFASLDAKESVGVAIVTPSQQRKLRQASPAFVAAAGAWGKAGATKVALADVYADMAAAALSMAWEGAMAQDPPKARTAKKQPAAKRAAKKSPAAPPAAKTAAKQAKRTATKATKATKAPKAAKAAKKPRVARRRG